jgi:hypothetical protein
MCCICCAKRGRELRAAAAAGQGQGAGPGRSRCPTDCPARAAVNGGASRPAAPWVAAAIGGGLSDQCRCGVGQMQQARLGRSHVLQSDAPQEGNAAAPAIVTPPKNRTKVFTWKTETKQEASQQHLQGGLRHPKTPPLLTPTPSRESFCSTLHLVPTQRRGEDGPPHRPRSSEAWGESA